MGVIKRIGILTGGGDCPGLNAVIRAVTKAAINAGIEVIGISEGYKGLVQNLVRPLSNADVSGILPRGGTILGTSNRDNPFRFRVIDEDGEEQVEDRSQQVLDNYVANRLDALIVAGGDGTLTIASMLAQKGLPIVGIPKTIDNDLMATDTTFGFDTALQTATEAVDKLHTTAESHHRVMVLEVMGRNSGWIALHSGIAGGGDVILIPEIDFTYESVASSISRRAEAGKHFSIVVVAEGAHLPDGEQVVKKEYRNCPFPILGGVGDVVMSRLEDITGMESRVTVLGHLQRGGIPSPFDRILATRFGVRAVEVAIEGGFGTMVCLRTPGIEICTLEEAVSEQRKVPADGELVRFAKSVGMAFGDS